MAEKNSRSNVFEEGEEEDGKENSRRPCTFFLPMADGMSTCMGSGTLPEEVRKPAMATVACRRLRCSTTHHHHSLAEFDVADALYRQLTPDGMPWYMATHSDHSPACTEELIDAVFRQVSRMPNSIFMHA